MTEAASAALETAYECLDRERRELRCERDALERFRERVAAVGTTAGAAQRAGTGARLAGPPASSGAVVTAPDARVERVRQYYRETVMAVPHYEAVYGEPFAVNVRAELGDDVADALTADTTTAFTSPLKRAVVTATDASIEERTTFLRTLEDEEASLDAARDVLVDVAAALDGAGPLNASQVAALLDDLDAVAATRQEHLHSTVAGGHERYHLLCAYLYGEPSWTYPVLNAVSTLRERLDERRRTR